MTRRLLDLELQRDDARGLPYLPEQSAECCSANRLDIGITSGNEDLSCWLICE